MWVTALATSMARDAKGKLELAGWFSIVLMLVLIAAHLARHAQHKSEVDDIIDELDTYIFHPAPNERDPP